MRYTERHAGKAVIRDKALLPEAMEKLAKVEDAKDDEVGLRKTITLIIQEVSEDICDHYCKYRNTADEENLCDWTRNGGSCPLDKLY